MSGFGAALLFARLTWKRMLRGKALWLTALLLTVPIVIALFATSVRSAPATSMMSPPSSAADCHRPWLSGAPPKKSSSSGLAAAVEPRGQFLCFSMSSRQMRAEFG